MRFITSETIHLFLWVQVFFRDTVFKGCTELKFTTQLGAE